MGRLFPRQAQNKCVELRSAQFQCPVTGTSAEVPFIQAPVSQPDTVAVMNQYLHPVGAAVGKQEGIMRYRRTKHLNDPRQDRLRARAHVERFDRQP